MPNLAVIDGKIAYNYFPTTTLVDIVILLVAMTTITSKEFR